MRYKKIRPDNLFNAIATYTSACVYTRKHINKKVGVLGASAPNPLCNGAYSIMLRKLVRKVKFNVNIHFSRKPNQSISDTYQACDSLRLDNMYLITSRKTPFLNFHKCKILHL